MIKKHSVNKLKLFFFEIKSNLKICYQTDKIFSHSSGRYVLFVNQHLLLLAISSAIEWISMNKWYIQLMAGVL